MWFLFQGVPRCYLRLASPHRRSDRVSRGRMVPFPCRWIGAQGMFYSPPVSRRSRRRRCGTNHERMQSGTCMGMRRRIQVSRASGRHTRRQSRGKMKKDWAVSLGAGGVAQGMSPAKYSFNVNAAPSCSADFAVFPINASTGNTRAKVVGTFTGAPTSGQTASITITPTGGTAVTLTLTASGTTNTGIRLRTVRHGGHRRGQSGGGDQSESQQHRCRPHRGGCVGRYGYGVCAHSGKPSDAYDRRNPEQFQLGCASLPGRMAPRPTSSPSISSTVGQGRRFVICRIRNSSFLTPPAWDRSPPHLASPRLARKSRTWKMTRTSEQSCTW